ncbi:alcohol dehydrogenase (NADP+) [[Emmonsia] crescens]|uniref:alcohol dehydrogenase (NADP(+)) n=1 Tax=[Emmonsia] crescens TaxID=73230 RepID=A0A2B7ZLG6_9EURO|nr:alcohol dehydrogenase (NADP+) [Emmonsia crescens]
MTSSIPTAFHGWVGHSATTPLTHTAFQPKPFDPTDIEIKITHCGICGSDIHTLRSGWGPTNYPCVVGHEIVGHVTRVGSGVASISSPSRHLKVGDRVGIGAQSDSCRRPDCPECASGLENHCQYQTGTYGGRFRDGSKSYGGYATHWRGPAWFAFKLPDSLPSAAAAPLLCAGITVFSPLVKNGAGPGKSVGIVGIGGLGHLGLLFAKALGCDHIIAISRTSAKKAEALGGLGADKFIATDEDKGWAKTHARSLDLIISTVSSSDMPIGNYLRLMKVNGQFIQVGAPEEPFPAFRVFPLISKGVKIGGSAIGSPEEIRRMLQLAADKNVLPWIQERPMEDVNNALADMHAGKARYRYVLVNKPGSAVKL